MTDFFESSIVSFTPGDNILVCYQVHFHGDSFITEETVLEELFDDVASNGEITDSAVFVKRSSLEAQTTGMTVFKPLSTTLPHKVKMQYV